MVIRTNQKYDKTTSGHLHRRIKRDDSHDRCSVNEFACEASVNVAVTGVVWQAPGNGLTVLVLWSQDTSYPARVHRISARGPSRSHGPAGRASWPGPLSWWPSLALKARTARPMPTWPVVRLPGAARAGPSPTLYPGLSCSSNNWVVCGAVDNRVVFVSLWLVAEVGVRAATQPCGPRWSPAWWTARAALGHKGCAARTPTPRAVAAHTCQYLISFTCNKSQIYIHVDYRVIKFVNI